MDFVNTIQCEIEEIIDSRKKGNTTEYLVRWTNSWENEKRLKCKDLIKQFKIRSGEDVNNGDNEDEDEEKEEESEESPKRGRPRKTTTAGKKRKISEKSNKGKRRRRQ